MFDFLTELAENNNKEWFDAHKTQYESAKLEATTLFKHIYSILTELAEYLCTNFLKTKKSSCGMVLHGEFCIKATN